MQSGPEFLCQANANPMRIISTGGKVHSVVCAMTWRLAVPCTNSPLCGTTGLFHTHYFGVLGLDFLFFLFFFPNFYFLLEVKKTKHFLFRMVNCLPCMLPDWYGCVLNSLFHLLMIVSLCVCVSVCV